jgi:hypothetical protein
MCIVIDASALAAVFNADDAGHDNFSPVMEWVTRGRGKVVYGGTTYMRELRAVRSLLELFLELTRQRRVVRIEDAEVDAHERRIVALVRDRRFDDPHLAAIVCVARCALICTRDNRAFGFLKRRDLYSEVRCDVPRLYTSKRNRDLLCDQHIVGRCVDEH